MRFRQEPPYAHGAPSRTAVVLVNLGTPDSPTAPAVRRYLKQFLSDPRVVEIPRAAWWPILHGIILPLRSGRSAKKYASIWSTEGSPLKVHTERQAALLQEALTSRGHQVDVAYAMRYGSPSVPEVLEQLRARACDRILIVPAYPQYSGTTTASVFDAVFSHFSQVRNVPELRMVRNYHDHDGYIRSLAASVFAHWESHGRPDRLVLSFHGVPRRTLTLGDPYHCECRKTARLLAAQLQMPEDQCMVTFQSRFGKAEWLQPYTAPTLQRLASEGVARVDVMCPGFIGDCLETLEEISMEARHDFLAAGGKDFHYIPCLNEMPEWIAALAEIAEQHLVGWPTVQTTRMHDEALRQSEFSRERAMTLGADK